MGTRRKTAHVLSRKPHTLLCGLVGWGGAPTPPTQTAHFLFVLGVCAFLTGCSTTATYTRGPDAVTCVRPAHSPGSGLLGLLTSPLYAKAEYDAATQFAQCKTAAERLGFTRQP